MSFADEIRAYLATADLSGAAKRKAADALGISQQVIEVMLAAEGLTFRQLKHEERLRRMRRLIQQHGTNPPTAIIASAMGFDSTSTYSSSKHKGPMKRVFEALANEPGGDSHDPDA